MRHILQLLFIAAALYFTGCQFNPVPQHGHPVVVEDKHFFPRYLTTNKLGFKEEILPDRYVVEFYDSLDGYYHFVQVEKTLWDSVRVGDTLLYNDTIRVLYSQNILVYQNN